MLQKSFDRFKYWGGPNRNPIRLLSPVTPPRPAGQYINDRGQGVVNHGSLRFNHAGIGLRWPGSSSTLQLQAPHGSLLILGIGMIANGMPGNWHVSQVRGAGVGSPA